MVVVQTEGNQDSTLSDSQQSIALTQSEIEENGSNANLDINSIINEVLRKFIDASLGTTEISGGLLSDTINANDIIINELVFASDGQVIDISDIRLNIIKLEASANQFVNNLRDINDKLTINHDSLESSFNVLSSNHYSLESSFNVLSSNHNSLENTVNDLTNNHYSLESSFNELSSNHYSLESRVKINDISQTFYEIMTQQPNKFKKQANISRNTSTIILNWDYDHLIPYHDYDSIYKSQLAYLSASNIKLAQLPFIDKIQIDISGKFEDKTQSGWLDLSTINIPLDICYNTTIYKSLTITKLGNIINNVNDVNYLLNNNNYFDIRVYGINNAINYPSIEERALIYSDLSFEQANVPSKPSITSNNVLNKSEISISTIVNQTEKDISNSSAKIKTLDISYSLNESLRSSYLSFNSSDYYVKNEIKDFSNNLINQNVQFRGDIINLFPGSNYNYQARVKNNLNDLSYSEYSDISLSNYTLLPSSSVQNTKINFSVDNSINRYITNIDFDNTEVIYINLSDSNDKIDFQNTSSQIFEITNPDASVNGINKKGYGKFLDTMPSSNSDLVTINVYVDDASKQTIIYDNSFTRTNAINIYSHSYFVDNEFKIEDMYFNEPVNVNVNKGFRLKGRLRLNHITDSDSIKEKIGQPSSSPYKLTFEYLRHSDVNGVNSTIDHDIYIDDFSGIPVINTIDNSNVVTQLAYNMGIPSVQSFNLKFERNYNAINSQYKYFIKDKKISKINPINNTSAKEKTIILNNRADISSSGSYYYNYTEFDNATNDDYKNLNYTNSLLTNNYNLSWNEIVYNLYSTYKTDGNTFTISHVTNHFCDYNSFDLSNQKINNSKLNLSALHIYEINNISELSNNISNLTISRYTNHDISVKDSTLLYIDGSFQSNVGNIYPDLNSYNYNGINLNNIYSAGNISYDLNGISTGTNNNGYKFIVFQIKKSNPEDDSDYMFNDISYSRITYDSKSYISIKSMLNGLFDVNIIDKLFDLNDNDAIGFVRVTLKLNNITRIGNLKKEYNPYGGDWLNNGSSPVSYNESLNFGYGCKVENINQDKGIVINPSTVNDNLTLFIGLKNN